MSDWTPQHSRELYGVELWGSGFFEIGDNGNVHVAPEGPAGHRVDLYKLTNDLKERGIRLPILVRFSDILGSRINLLNNCFSKAIHEYGYNGTYRGVFPVKVNQQKHLVEEIVQQGKIHHMGLECGSKPELLITLALMDNSNGIIICNGFKDSEYVETALLAQKLGHNVFIVVDRQEEIQLIINAAKKLSVKPRIGFRCKLNAKGEGKWQESSGAHSKFGLTPSEMVQGCRTLQEADLLNALEMLHFHIGSQIPSIHAIKSAMKEGARYFTEMKSIAPNINYLDVGGGLGVDYDGSGNSSNSTNYSEQEYANDIVSTLQHACDEKGISHPHIITESGRALVAHSSVLIFEVLGENEIYNCKTNISLDSKDSSLVKEIYEIYSEANEKNINETYNDLVEKRRDTLQMFNYGVLNIVQRAKAEDLYWATAKKLTDLSRGKEDYEDIFYAMEKELSGTYFCNFSVFQSLPDSWALQQLFPVLPLHRHLERPEKRAILVDLTCDSDGKIDQFIDVDTGNTQSYLELHDLKKDEPYLLGAFITGAYQEILGDLHNLFGDTDAVHISVVGHDSYQVDHVIKGDSVSEVLSYVEYKSEELTERIRRHSELGIARGLLTHQEARLLIKRFETGLSGYTYFMPHPEED
ncbi:MAG: arginine decarboxylase [Bdellovibrionaceae bacterium]|nr:arginine decarboxylase [Pseudobdellovibrionaceae bacterium]|tara:strand:- start:81376 stop:83292 length:1917 start_codon:yes stop_codon:yes gene_type:complete